MILLVELYLEELKQVWPTFPETIKKKMSSSTPGRSGGLGWASSWFLGLKTPRLWEGGTGESGSLASSLPSWPDHSSRTPLCQTSPSFHVVCPHEEKLFPLQMDDGGWKDTKDHPAPGCKSLANSEGSQESLASRKGHLNVWHLFPPSWSVQICENEPTVHLPCGIFPDSFGYHDPLLPRIIKIKHPSVFFLFWKLYAIYSACLFTGVSVYSFKINLWKFLWQLSANISLVCLPFYLGCLFLFFFFF